MNILGYQATDDNGLSIELIIDGVPLGNLIGSRDTAIPYWIFDDDLPRLPPFGESRNLEKRIVTVCSCGEYGCGHAHCTVLRSSDTVTLRDFDVDVSADGSKCEFRIAKTNYDIVMSEILEKVNAQKAKGQRKA